MTPVAPDDTTPKRFILGDALPDRSEVAPDDTPPRLMDKIESYPFESEGGDLRLCVHWQELRAEVSRLREALQQTKDTADRELQLHTNVWAEKRNYWLKRADEAEITARDAKWQNERLVTKLQAAEADVSRLQQENANLSANVTYLMSERESLIEEDRLVHQS